MSLHIVSRVTRSLFFNYLDRGLQIMKRTGSPVKKNTLHTALLLGCSLMFGSVANVQAQSSLEDAVLRALETNPEVEIRWHDFRAAGYATRAARGGFRPDVSLNAAYGRQRENFITGNPMNVGFAEIALTQLLWDGGRTRANVNEFDAEQLVRYFELLDIAEQTTLEAMRAYIDVLRQRELVRLAEDSLQTHEEVFEQVAESVRAGVGRAADLEQINGRLALAEANLLNELANLHDVSARYLRVVGDLPPDRMQGLELQMELPATVHDSLMEAYRHNPIFHAALRNISAAEFLSDAQRAERMPRLNLAARYGVQTRDEFGTREDHWDGRIGLELTMDLYTGGRNTANVRRAVARESSAMSLRDRTCVNIRQDVQIAFNDRQNLARQLPILNQHRISSDRVRTAYRQQFEIGQRTLLDVLDSENEFFEASRAWTNASFDESVAIARTIRHMGLLLETLSLRRGDVPTLDEIGAEPMEIDPMTACPLPAADRLAALSMLTDRQPRATTTAMTDRGVATAVTLSSQTTFALDSDELRPAARETLSQLVTAIREGGLMGQIQVIGHTCDLGPEAHNQDLSERRAQSVVSYLRAAGIGADEIVSEGRGQHEPRYPNDGEQNRSRNRRVEISFRTEQRSTTQLPVSKDGPITEIRQTDLNSDTPAVGQAKPALGQGQSTEIAVQLGSFAVKDNAIRLVDQLKELEFDAFVLDSKINEEPVWLVRVRAPADREAAAALQQALRDETGLDGRVVGRSA